MNYRTAGEKLLYRHYHPYPNNGRAHGAEWVQYRDLLPPETLRGVEWVERCYDVWPRQFLGGITGKGLVPVGGNPQANRFYAVQRFDRLSPMQAVYNLAKMVTWNNKAEELQRAREYAATLFELHRHHRSGWYYGVDADTGEPCADRHNITSYGLLRSGLELLGMVSEAQAVEAVVNRYVEERDYALPEQWTAYGPLVQDWSSDGCYYVRLLTDDPKKKKWAAFYSDQYFNTEWGHSTTHRDGNSWYSDGVVNQLVMHIMAGRLDRFDSCWRVLVRESVDGIPAAILTAGSGNGKPHNEPHLHFEALVERAEATQQASDIYEAKRFADLLIGGDIKVRNDIFGRDLIRLGSLLGE